MLCSTLSCTGAVDSCVAAMMERDSRLATTLSLPCGNLGQKLYCCRRLAVESEWFVAGACCGQEGGEGLVISP